MCSIDSSVDYNSCAYLVSINVSYLSRGVDMVQKLCQAQKHSLKALRAIYPDTRRRASQVFTSDAVGVWESHTHTLSHSET